jgi:hypothetical protein
MIFADLSMERTPAAKPPLILYQLESAAEMMIPTLWVFVIRAARIPARYEPCWLEVVVYETRPLARFVGTS